eukprot:TRINITY_DN3176_c0_g1_i3.p1 TRINITY_DN3176_c0_g1~~TRINITY_DN3176_c0_g1_i3.p1  ORF type:complete len:168 (+),score=9.05 TRINITY_DN3176_c0_g1_i3:47-550(+)
MASGDLTWALLRKNSSFIIKRDGVTFNSEPNNLLAQNSFKFSGLSNKKTIGVTLDKEKKKISLTLKRTKGNNPRRPAKSNTKVPLSKHIKNHTCRSAVAIRTLTQKSYYRPDLTKYAIARYHAFHRSLKVDTTKATKKRAKRGRRAQKAAAAVEAAAAAASASAPKS